jgi:hypothetical protein
VGGNLAILDTISHTIRERVRIKGEIRVLTSQVITSDVFGGLADHPVRCALAGESRLYDGVFQPCNPSSASLLWRWLGDGIDWLFHYDADAAVEV